MINIITNTIKNKYYVYQPGEFLPILIDGELANRREFHAYKARRAAWMLKNHRQVIHHYTHQAG